MIDYDVFGKFKTKDSDCEIKKVFLVNIPSIEKYSLSRSSSQVNILKIYKGVYNDNRVSRKS